MVDNLPWVSLFLGVLSLLSTLLLWQWSHATKASISYFNQLKVDAGGQAATAHRLSMVVWFSIFILLIQSVLFLAAISATRRRHKSGWNLLFYAAITNLSYGIIITLSAYDGGGRMIMSLLTSALGVYFLFQIRSFYLGRKATIRQVS